MNKIFSTILTLFVLASSAHAGTLSADKIKSDVLGIILENYSKRASAEFDRKITMLPFQSLTVPDGVISYEIVNQSENTDINSRDIVRVNLLVDNKLQRTLSVPISVKAYEEVLVAAENIPREQPINSSRVVYKKMNIADKGNFVLTRNMITKEMVAKKDFKEGEYIDRRFVKVRPDVTRNSEVRIILNSDSGFQIAIDGIAKTEGTIGEYVTVENKMYNKTYTGKVIGENKVQVNI